MGRQPTKAAGNIYCKARKMAAKTKNPKFNSREGAAEILGYDPSTVAGWELDTDNPSKAAVDAMAAAYDAPELRHYYCKNICLLGCDPN